MNLFVYGTLLFPEIRELVAGRSLKGTPATISGYQRFRVKDANFPAIIPTGNSKILKGEILFDLTELEFQKFDRYEDVFYQRLSTTATHEKGESDVEIYAITDSNQYHHLTNEPWELEWFRENYFEEFLKRLQGY